jgi:nicotinamidase-related amidase
MAQRKKTWTEQHLPPDYQELAKKRHLPMPGRIGYGERPAVLIIDMAKSWTDPDSPMGSDMTDAIEAINKILEITRRPGGNYIPVYFSLMKYDKELRSITRAHNAKRPHLAKLLVEGSPWLEIDPRLNKRDDELLIVKEHGSCFTDTVLLRTLISNKCDTLIITGCSTSACVMMTACDCNMLGFRGIIPAETVADRDPIMHQYMLLNLDWKVADVEPLKDVLAYLEKFKEGK